MISKEELTKIREEDITTEEMYDYLEELGAEPRYMNDGNIVCCTCCHNGPHKGSHKLYYYTSNKMFRCYTGCDGEPLFDVYELTKRVKGCEGVELNYITAAAATLKSLGKEVDVLDEKDFIIQNPLNDYLTNLKKYDTIENKERYIQKAEMNILDEKYLNNLPTPVILPWIKDNIKKGVMDFAGICFEPKNYCIIIPHYNENGDLIGIRERTMVEEQEVYGKYKPATIHGIQYNHPLSLNLYGLNWAKDNIKTIKKAIVVESEKAVLQYMSYFGIENNIAVAACGSAISAYQIELLKKYGAEEVIIAFDRCGSEEKREISKYVKKFYHFQNKYGNEIKLSFIYDKDGKYLGLKDSPLDKGKDIFLNLFRERINLYE